jgi:histone-lysine N-methyltransferase MLL3
MFGVIFSVVSFFVNVYSGLKLIEEEDSEKEEEARCLKRSSPIIPIISPIPIRLRPGMQILKETNEVVSEIIYSQQQISVR